jgi:two-component system, LytTR family, response regulator
MIPLELPCRAVVIDDEPSARAVVKAQVQRSFAGTVKIVSEADSVDSGIVCIREYAPRLVFLDVDLGDGTGFDVLDAFNPERYEEQFCVIFITSFPNFAIQAIRYQALDFLTKPIVSTDFRVGVDRALAKLGKTSVAPEQAISRSANAVLTQDTIVIHQANDVVLLPIDTIEFCEADRGDTEFFLISGESEMSARTLTYYEPSLTARGFLKISRSCCVNTRCIRKVNKFTNERKMELVMQSGAIVRPTADYQESILRLLQQQRGGA